MTREEGAVLARAEGNAAAPSRRPPEGVFRDAAGAPDEAARCLRCDCRKADACRLRQAAEACVVHRLPTPGETRRPVALVLDHPAVRYEPGKCIRCGLCVRLAERQGESPGLAFTGRGWDAEVRVPFDGAFADGLRRAAAACVEACPTAALSWKRDRDEPGQPDTPTPEPREAIP